VAAAALVSPQQQAEPRLLTRCESAGCVVVPISGNQYDRGLADEALCAGPDAAAIVVRNLLVDAIHCELRVAKAARASAGGRGGDESAPDSPPPDEAAFAPWLQVAPPRGQLAAQSDAAVPPASVDSLIARCVATGGAAAWQLGFTAAYASNFGAVLRAAAVCNRRSGGDTISQCEDVAQRCAVPTASVVAVALRSAQGTSGEASSALGSAAGQASAAATAVATVMLLVPRLI
jgi:hypothetical protein